MSSDIVMPDRYAYVKAGERDVDNAMPWDKIEPADYSIWNKQTNFDLAISNSKKRLEQNKQLKLIDENAKWINDRSEDDAYSLKMDKFKEEQLSLEETAKKYKPISEYQNKLNFVSLPYEKTAIQSDVTLKEKRERWHENLSKDIYVEEALNVLDDLQSKPIVKGLESLKKKTIKS